MPRTINVYRFRKTTCWKQKNGAVVVYLRATLSRVKNQYQLRPSLAGRVGAT